jgi:superfamily I DNA/RNA helicase
VAMTRAKETLIITWAKRRRIFGRERDRKLSPFIDDIQKSLKKPVRSINPEKKKQKQIQLELFGKLSSR